ncbi:MAG: SMP-30/gluconolactonase/LRE family protein [Burkholderiales bacterium]|nr:SMP-30/gluconolactonase/LRE family protein [Burkholderiales bacterium]
MKFVRTHLQSVTLALVLAVSMHDAAAQTDAGFPPPIGDRGLVPAGAKLERLFDGGCVLTEGVAAGHDGMIYFSDITFTAFCKDPSGKYLQAGNIWKYDPRSGQTTIFRSPSGMSNGLKFDRDGNMLAALGADYGGRMLIKTDMKTGKSYVLTGMYEGKPYNALNDITIDEKGRIYFTDPRYLGHEPVMADGFAAYRLDPDGKVTRVATNCGKCNGILISPDQKTMYIVSNDNGWLEFQNLKKDETTVQGPHLLQAYDVGADGSLSNRRVLIDYGKLDKPCSGPDGMIADEKGNIWLASRCEHRPGVQALDKDGKELAYISTGTELPTNVGFGRGADANLLYVTSGKSLYRIRVGVKGYQLP